MMELRLGVHVAVEADFLTKKSHGFDRGHHLQIESADAKFSLILDDFTPAFKAMGVEVKEGTVLRIHLFVEVPNADA